MADQRADEASRFIGRALEAVGGRADEPLIDAMIAPAAAVAATRAFADRTKTSLVLVSHPRPGDVQAAYGPEPRDPYFLRFAAEKDGVSARLVGVRGEGAAEVRIKSVRVDRALVPCCELPSCEAKRERVRTWLELEDRDRLLIAEGRPLAGQPDDGASDLARALAGALGVELEGDAGESRLDPVDDSLTLPVDRAGRYTATSEAEFLVFRDLFSIGPRASAGRNFAIAAVVAVIAAGVWIPTAGLARAGSTGPAVAVGAIAALLTLTAYAFFGVARFSSRYVAPSAPLATFGRGRFVVLPWVGRGGAIDLRPEGRFGAAIGCNEVTGVSVAPRDGSFAVVLESDHGPIDMIALSDERLASSLRAAVARAVELAKHPDAKPSPRQRARAKAQERPAKAS